MYVFKEVEDIMKKPKMKQATCVFRVRSARMLTGHVHDEEVHRSLFDGCKRSVPGPLHPQIGVIIS